ncbi:SusE domain-containing protein [Dinghuibacter silviterrae]|uniref:SusE-like outer membrane protein n=1 Tax=Dinghuibacter silviterrae TaxID=1539049 RepID=A0A4R8DVU1_9BACT|nr:SusE domain-containing protein [Dinghuibacter silviterrae]TDX01331.1 SusE-like outer membrane protein [Dinghuibacter silviterrae]
MRRILYISAFLLLAAACKKSYNYGLDQTVSAVSTLYAPQDSLFLSITPGGSSVVEFEWAPAQAQDGSLVQYEVAFDTTKAFKNPVFTVAADNTGQGTTATISQSTINSIAKMAGIGNLDTGKLYWTVFSTKGLNVVPSSKIRMMTVVRPAGFDVIPTDVYLTGSATEGGTTLSGAIHFKSTAAGVFELYTSLKNGGTYQFVNGTTGTPLTYFIQGPNLKLGGSNTYTDTTAQVRFNLDFNNAVATITVIRSVDVWYGYYDNVTYHLTYNGNSTWIDNNQLINEPTEPWGPEERYKFRFTVNDGGGAQDSYEWYGSSAGDNSEPTATTAATYFYLTPVTSDQWNNCYKFSTPLDNGKLNNIEVFLQPDAPYTHTVTPQ